MKKIIIAVLFSSVFTAFTVNAKQEIIKLEDNSALLGKWEMNFEAPALHKEKKKVQNDWEFRSNGIIAAKSRDPRLDAVNEVKVKYSVENGVIKKQTNPGREKYETCKVIKLDDKKMILRCKYLFYFFTKK